MARFCDYCGRKLEQGEICNCRMGAGQTPNPTPGPRPNPGPRPTPVPNSSVTSGAATEKIALVFKNIGGMITSPSKTIEKFTNMNDKAYGLIMMGLYVLVMFIAGVILATQVDMDKASNMIVIVFIVIGIVNSYIFALITYGITNKVLKQNTTMPGIFSIVGVQSVLSILLTIITLIMFKMSVLFGVLILAVSTVLTFSMFCINLCEQIVGDSDKKLLAITITYACYYIILFVTIYLMISTFFRNITNGLSPMDSLDFLNYLGLFK